MSDLMCRLEFVHCYIDDLLIINKTVFANHLDKVKVALKWLEKAGLKINTNKSWVTVKDIQPMPNKVKSILQMQTPKNCKHLC